MTAIVQQGALSGMQFDSGNRAELCIITPSSDLTDHEMTNIGQVVIAAALGLSCVFALAVCLVVRVTKNNESYEYDAGQMSEDIMEESPTDKLIGEVVEDEQESSSDEDATA
jgi:hypothetical protein